MADYIIWGKPEKRKLSVPDLTSQCHRLSVSNKKEYNIHDSTLRSFFVRCDYVGIPVSTDWGRKCWSWGSKECWIFCHNWWAIQEFSWYKWQCATASARVQHCYERLLPHPGWIRTVSNSLTFYGITIYLWLAYIYPIFWLYIDIGARESSVSSF